MLLLDATHTSHTRAQTGIQRVCHSLHAALAAQQPVRAVCHDPYLGAWRELNAREARCLQPGQAATGSRGARWPRGAKAVTGALLAGARTTDENAYKVTLVEIGIDCRKHSPLNAALLVFPGQAAQTNNRDTDFTRHDWLISCRCYHESISLCAKMN